jgi:hypothetical protein
MLSLKKAKNNNIASTFIMNPIAYNSLLVKKPLVLEEKTSRVMQVQK